MRIVIDISYTDGIPFFKSNQKLQQKGKQDLNQSEGGFIYFRKSGFSYHFDIWSRETDLFISKQNSLLSNNLISTKSLVQNWIKGYEK